MYEFKYHRPTTVRQAVNLAIDRQEIIDNGGPDIGYPGDPQNTPLYDNVVQRVNDGQITPEEGAAEIGKIYDSGESVSGTKPPKTYGDYMRDWYGNEYDNYHP